MRRVTFEAATLVDAISKANRVAPRKGAAWDRAAGIKFCVDEAAGATTIQSTNLEMTYSQVVPSIGVVNDQSEKEWEWRLPSQVIASLFSTLDMGPQAQIALIDTQQDSFIRIKAGTVTGKYAKIVGDYPDDIFEEFSSVGMSTAHDFASKAEQVAWACGDEVLAGVHIDGTSLLACNRYVVACVPCEVPVDRAVTVPLREIAPLLRQGTDVRLRSAEDRLQILLDDETRVTSVIFGQQYPDVKRLFRTDFTGHAEVSKTALEKSLGRMLTLAKEDKIPRLTMRYEVSGFVSEMVLDLESESVGRLQDIIPVQGELGAESFVQYINPHYLIGAITGTRNELLRIDFGPNPTSTVKVTDGKGYETHLQPIRVQS